MYWVIVIVIAPPGTYVGIRAFESAGVIAACVAAAAVLLLPLLALNWLDIHLGGSRVVTQITKVVSGHDDPKGQLMGDHCPPSPPFHHKSMDAEFVNLFKGFFVLILLFALTIVLVCVLFSALVGLPLGVLMGLVGVIALPFGREKSERVLGLGLSVFTIFGLGGAVLSGIMFRVLPPVYAWTCT